MFFFSAKGCMIKQNWKTTAIYFTSTQQSYECRTLQKYCYIADKISSLKLKIDICLNESISFFLKIERGFLSPIFVKTIYFIIVYFFSFSSKQYKPFHIKNKGTVIFLNYITKNE